MRRRRSSSFLVACGLALAIGSTGCNRNGRADEATRARGHEGAPINLTGCLQKSGRMNTFVLTQVNEPTKSVGTSGSAGADTGVVEQQQMREARHAFRLAGDDDRLETLVGKQVRVEGTIAENSDLRKYRNADKKPEDISAGDLAKVDVNSIIAVADVCGGEK